MDNNKIKEIISDKDFLEELEEAINSGKQKDYEYREEFGEEVEIDVFHTDTAKQSVIQLLKEYFIK